MFDWLRETRPAATGFEFVRRGEQRLARDDVDVDAGGLVVQQRASTRPFGGALLRHAILLGGQCGYRLSGLLVLVHEKLRIGASRDGAGLRGRKWLRVI